MFLQVLLFLFFKKTLFLSISPPFFLNEMLKSFVKITHYLKTLGKFIGPGFMIAVG